MTKAYMKGFCKVAEQFGVNPYSLLKYATDEAQEAPRDFRAPSEVQAVGSTKLPLWDPESRALSHKSIFNIYNLGMPRSKYLQDIVDASRYYGTPEAQSAVDSDVAAGQYGKDWYPAHTNAVNYAKQPLQRASDRAAAIGGQAQRYMDENLTPQEQAMAIQRYHESMLAQTGMPQRVSAPAIK